ncbi:MAG: hypothetical protein IRY85_05400 [Micromonosporaceae bacterium]|nr:hypothetical protein [Micromonosporaceae bacterium]
MKLFGWGGSPRDRFARQVLRTVQASGLVASARYDEADFSIEFQLIGESNRGRIYLENTFRETEQASIQERSMRIRRLVDTVLGSTGLQPWVPARGKLRPVLRAATFGLGIANGSVGYLSRPALPFLVEAVVVDEPTSMAYVNQRQLAEWGVTADEVFATARANLAAQVPRADEPPATGPAMLRFVETGDAYVTSMLLVDGFLAGLAPRVGGRPVAFVPDRDTLIVVGEHPGLLATVYGMVEEQYRQAPRSVSPVGYTVDDRGAVVPYTAPAGTELDRVVHRAEVLLAATEYAAQKTALDADHERQGIDDVFVGSLLVAERPDSSTVSITVWAGDGDVLLPQADVVAFPPADLDGSPPLTVPFDVVAREASLVPEPDYNPPRYRVTRWPDETVMARLVAHAVEI